MIKNKYLHLLAKAQKERDRKNYAESIRLCNSVIKHEPDNGDAYEILALAALESQDFYLAESAGRETTRLQPLNPNGALITSVSLMNRAKEELAIEVLEDQLSRTPEIIALMFNLHSCYANQGNNQKAIEIALKTVQLAPTNADAYNNLGASLHAVSRNEDANIAFQTAVDLNPQHFTARLNLANSLVDHDERKIQVINETVEKFGKLMPERSRIGSLHNTAFAYLRLGQLEKGWERLEHGFSPLIDSNRGRRPQRNFEVPRWKGEPLKGKRLLVWREQGLGDEIMFGSMLPELAGIDGQVILECEPRLVEMLARSFPQFKVRHELYRAVYPHDSPYDDFDLQIPLGSLAAIYRQHIEDFDRSAPYLLPDPDKKAEYASRLRELAGDKKLVGICWRSGVVSPTRGNSYTLLSDWDALFQDPDICVVNLQYGKCEDELLAIEQQHGIRIVRWEDTNLQTDLEAVVAIISNLDVVCSVGTVVAQFGGALGIPTLMCANAYHWTSFGTQKYPFFPDIHLFVDQVSGGDMQVSARQATSVVLQLQKT
jgi:tetratricopeptide (TPR) repeat protein